MKEPIEMKAGDERVLVNGLSLPVDYRIVWEENYKELKRAFDLHNVSQQSEPFINFAKEVIEYYEQHDIGDEDIYNKAKKLINGG